MADMPKILNTSGSNNYIAGTKVFILDDIKPNNCNELIGHLCNLVDSLGWTEPFDIKKQNTQITNPYNISVKNPIIDIYLDSIGGTIHIYNSIMTLLNLARAKGAIIRTTIMGEACSCASLIAVQGTPNFRIMHETSYHYIHYGRSPYSITKAEELERVYNHEKDLRDKLVAPYKQNAKISDKELKRMTQAEECYINANDCLKKYELCDWILTRDGKFMNRKTNTR